MSSARPGVDVISIAVDDRGNRYAQFRCPGCAQFDRRVPPIHSLPVRPFNGPEDSWDWNNDVVRPVFSPSVLSDKDGPHRCHAFVGCHGAQPGQIVFLGDCDHTLRGQVADLVPWLTRERMDPWGDQD